MRTLYIILSLFIIIISYIIYDLIETLEILNTKQRLMPVHCRHFPIDGSEGPEDVVEFGDILIYSATNHLKLYEIKGFGPSKIKGGLFAYYPSEQYHPIKITNYPKNTTFRPFGIDLFGTKLYVINENYEISNDRIEVFDIKKLETGEITLNYLYFMSFKENFLGRFNDLLVLEENKFLITTYYSIPDPDYGRSDSRNWLNTLKKYYLALTKQKFTYVYHAIGKPNEDVDIVKIQNTDAIMNNGIAKSTKNNYVYIAKTMEKKISIYSLNPKEKNDMILKLIREIDTPCLPDNINYSNDNDVFYIGCTGRPIDHLSLIYYVNKYQGRLGIDEKYWNGVVKIENKDDVFNQTVETVIMQDNVYFGISGAIYKNEELMIGSFFENDLLICKTK